MRLECLIKNYASFKFDEPNCFNLILWNKKQLSPKMWFFRKVDISSSWFCYLLNQSIKGNSKMKLRRDYSSVQMENVIAELDQKPKGNTSNKYSQFQSTLLRFFISMLHWRRKKAKYNLNELIQDFGQSKPWHTNCLVSGLWNWKGLNLINEISFKW